RLIDHSVALDRAMPGEAGRNDSDAEVPAAVLRAGMADVLMTVVRDIQRLRRERLLETLPNLRDAVSVAHGWTCSTGLIVTSANTPSSTYGSFAAHASQSSCESNSATIRLPVKPAGPGSGASIAGWGPAKRKRPASIKGCRYSRWRGRVILRSGRLSGTSRAMIA